ncbi:HlyD family secretion protein [Lachnospiraceae bacterium A10]|jgi:HlyD family secretion protein|nr:HlyD family secretion protein [Lachnospiraceae bacterium A10]
MKQNGKKIGKKGKIIIGIVVALVVVIAIVAAVLFNRKESYDEYVYGDVSYEFEPSYYSGVVEAQQTLEVQRDSSKDIDQVYVKVGDEVTTGQALFSYKTDELTLQLEQAKIELQSLGTDITDYNTQITNLTNEMNAADASLKPDYQMQINELNTSLKQAQLSQKTKQAEIDSIQTSIDEATVNSTIDGVVKSIASMNATEGAYITILATGNYQVKGTVDEMNVGMLSEGQTVTIHSRVDDQVWTGTISKIDTENKAQENNTNSYYYGDMGSGSEQTTKYYFYVALDDATGLLLGQHVYLEPDVDASMYMMEDESYEEIDGEYVEGEELGDEGYLEGDDMTEGASEEVSE